MAKRWSKKLDRDYADIARLLHDLTCSEADCTYGEEEPPEMRHSDDLPWPEQQRRAGLRLRNLYTCQRAVIAENLAATILRTVLR